MPTAHRTDVAPINSKGCISGRGGTQPINATINPAAPASTIGFLNGAVTVSINESFSASVPRRAVRSRIVKAIGEYTTIWKSRSGATNVASPSTNTAIGIPRLAEFTYEADSAPMVSSGSGRLSQIFATTTYRAPTAKAVADATASVGEKITERSDDARVVNSRAGVATKKTSRPRTNCPWLPRVPRRPRRYPTAMTTKITVKPATTPDTLRAPLDWNERLREILVRATKKAAQSSDCATSSVLLRVTTVHV